MRARGLIRHLFGPAGPLLIAGAAAAVPVASAEATVRAHPTRVLAGTGVLNDVVAISAKDAWAVGHSGSVNHPRTFIEHWNGTAWHRIAVSPAGGWLNGVAATSAHDVWAVGISHARPLILHFGGTTWRRVASPAAGGSRALLASVTAISPRNAWAVGNTLSKTIIEHWNGTTWRRVPSASPRDLPFLSGVAAASANDVWAVGGFTKTFILHWNGTRWRHVPSPGTGGAMLYDVTAISARNAWAVGSADRGTLILHWNGAAWHRARSPAIRRGAGLIGISGTSARHQWAVGASGALIVVSSQQARLSLRAADATRPGSFARPAAEPVILHWNGTAWRRTRSPAPSNGGQLIGVYAASGQDVWAVGCTKTFASTKAKPLVLHWNGTAWK
jgi:hypothetical protein